MFSDTSYARIFYGTISTSNYITLSFSSADYRAELYTRLVMEESKRQAQKSRVRKNPATRRDTSSQAEVRVKGQTHRGAATT